MKAIHLYQNFQSYLRSTSGIVEKKGHPSNGGAIKICAFLVCTTAILFSGHVVASSAAQQISLVKIGQINSPARKPAGITWDGSYLWQIDRANNGQLYQLRSNGTVIRRLSLAGGYSSGLTYDGRHLWYVETNIRRIFQLDPNTGHILQEFGPPGSGNIHELAWDGKFLWTTCSPPYRLYKLDPATGEEVENLPGPIPPSYTGSNPDYDLDLQGLTWDGRSLWVSETRTKTIMKLDPSTGDILSYHSAADLSYPYGFAWDGNHLWISEASGSHRIIKYRVSIATCTISGRVTGEDKKLVKAIGIYNLDDNTVSYETSLDRKGRFSASNLPAGEYRVVPLPGDGAKFDLDSSPAYKDVSCKGNKSLTVSFEITGIFDG